jgi:hypothetical protein
MALACAMLAIPAVGADAPTGGAPGTRAFVLSNVYIATPRESGVCSQMTQGAPEIFRQSLPESEQADYAGPEKQQQLLSLMQERLGFKWLRMVPREQASGDAGAQHSQLPIDTASGTVRIEDVRKQAGIPDGKGAIVFNHHIVAYDSCTDPRDFPMLNRGFQPYDGKIAFGMNLDGGNRGRGKAGSRFTGPNGERGVDNELWRVMGCMKHFREFGNPDNANGTLFSAAAPTLINISGIDNPQNDDDVRVSVYASLDPLVVDGRGTALAHASYTVDPRPDLVAETRGRLVQGVLTTEPVDLKLYYKEQIIDGTRSLRGAIIRAKIADDGSVEGGFYGYYTLASFYDSVSQMTQLGANLSSLSCPTIHAELQRHADGYPDPATGHNTAISSALNFVGVPAFVVQPAVVAGGQYAQ